MRSSAHYAFPLHHPDTPSKHLRITLSMASRKTLSSHPVVFALLWLDISSENALYAALKDAGLKPRSLLNRFHLTVYHARRTIPTLEPTRREVDFLCNVAETRMMVLAPGGENPRPGVAPNHHSLALRLTRRNLAIQHIQALRSKLTHMETEPMLGVRPPSSKTRNAFGARNFQPHIKICRANNGAPQDLGIVGNHIRSMIDSLRFSTYEVVTR